MKGNICPADSFSNTPHTPPTGQALRHEFCYVLAAVLVGEQVRNFPSSHVRRDAEYLKGHKRSYSDSYLLFESVSTEVFRGKY